MWSTANRISCALELTASARNICPGRQQRIKRFAAPLSSCPGRRITMAACGLHGCSEGHGPPRCTPPARILARPGSRCGRLGTPNPSPRLHHKLQGSWRMIGHPCYRLVASAGRLPSRLPPVPAFQSNTGRHCLCSMEFWRQQVPLEASRLRDSAILWVTAKGFCNDCKTAASPSAASISLNGQLHVAPCAFLGDAGGRAFEQAMPHPGSADPILGAFNFVSTATRSRRFSRLGVFTASKQTSRSLTPATFGRISGMNDHHCAAEWQPQAQLYPGRPDQRIQRMVLSDEALAAAVSVAPLMTEIMGQRHDAVT